MDDAPRKFWMQAYPKPYITNEKEKAQTGIIVAGKLPTMVPKIPPRFRDRESIINMRKCNRGLALLILPIVVGLFEGI
jgi:hypothetical protein